MLAGQPTSARRHVGEKSNKAGDKKQTDLEIPVINWFTDLRCKTLHAAFVMLSKLFNCGS